MAEKIGFIGLGIMGKPMVLNLLKAGFQVNVLSKSSSSAIVQEAGANVFESIADLTLSSDILITMLPDSPEVKQVVTEILPVIKKGSLFIDMSTIAPGVAKEIYTSLKEKGVSAIDAPVSGGQVGAEAGSLSIMAGGSQEAFNRALPVFQAMGKNIILIGDAGAGQVTKACNQMIVGITIQAVAEAFSMAKKAGVNLEKMREVLLGGFAQSRILDLHGKRMIDGNFVPGFKVKLHKKDMGIALQTGSDHQVSLKATELVASLMNQLVNEGHGELDHSSLFLLQEKN
ncbi:MAG: NAD(P)-dependent oxidoreductase [Bacteroidetes bacterium]|nr:NAD(P)-dependent oxidoreductase [Bacteroidota bacterium]